MNKYDGYVKIGTKIERKQLEEDIKEIETQLDKLHKKATKSYEVNGVKITGGWNLTEKEQKKYDDLLQTLEELEAKKVKLDEIDKKISNELEIQNTKINDQNLSTKETVKNQEKHADKINGLTKQLHEMVDNYNKMQNQDIVSSQDIKDAKELKKNIIKIAKEIEKITGQKISIKGITDIAKDTDKVKLSIGDIVKKVGKWTLAVFSLKTAYSVIRNAVSTISQYDEQIAADINYITYAVSMTLKPVVNWIVNAVKNLMNYVGYIAKAWFGINIWANSSADSMNATNKNAEELKKTLLGFDEINQLNDNTNQSSSLVTPSFDLSNGLADKDVPKWIKFIAEHKDEILEVVAALTAFFISKKIVSGISTLMGSASVGTGLLGLAATLAELVLFGAITIEVIVVYRKIVEAKEAIDEYNETQEELVMSSEKLTGKMQETIQKFNDTGGAVNKTDEEVRNYVDALFNHIDTNEKMIESMENTKTKLGELTGANDIATEAQDNYRESIVDHIEELENLFVQGKLTDEETKKFVDTIESEITALENSFDPLRKNTEEYKNNKKMAEELREKLLDLSGKYDIDVEMDVDTSKGKSKLSNFFSTLGENFVNFILPGNLNFKSIMSKIHFLSGGGIIDVPNTGVPLASNVIGGEAGAEGVLPLTNADTMSKLGREIGKWITLNVDLTTELDGRILNKRLETIKSNDNFSRNGG